MIGIVTINDYDNYGNRLQNYALQEVLAELGYNSETLINYPYSNTKDKFILRQIKNFKKKDGYSDNVNRANNFKSFNENIKFNEKKLTPYASDKKYDFYIVGSDQVWNPIFGRLREVDLLSFVRPSKRISYAASFGISSIEENINVSNELKKFKNISVRENKGKEIVKKLSGREDVEVVLDPTMLLDAHKWDSVIKRPKVKMPKKYILSYFLGDNDKYMSKIKTISAAKDLKVIDILNKNSPFFQCGPSEFLYLEKNAELICTDSFHSCVFALIFNKPLVVFERNQNIFSMNSRINTLITNFGLSNIKFDKEISDDNFKLFGNDVYEKINIERQKSIDFLKKSLKKENK